MMRAFFIYLQNNKHMIQKRDYLKALELIDNYHRQRDNIDMKTKFLINSTVFGISEKLKECFKFYEETFKDDGFILDKANQDVYKIFDREIHFNEGDRICLSICWIVKYKHVDLDDNVIIYYLDEE